jgi:glycosyltransferase involved in cell wall biosynthesis
MSRKPRILLIPNVAWWIIGEMGKQIIARFGDKYEFYFVPEGLLERRPELLQSLAPAVDAIHCLNESSIGLFSSFDRSTLPPIATWIHHVTTWSPDHQLSIEHSSALTVCTRGWKGYLEERVQGRIPITIVPHGIDEELFHHKKVDPAKFGIPAGRFVVGYVGAKSSDFDRGRKGTDVFLDVARRVAARVPNLHIVLGGPGWESELDGLNAQGISASATGYIRKSDLPALYSALDVYLLTSRVEGGPCTVFEAMACETAVVSTRVGAVPELIIDGINGFSAEVDDSKSLIEAIVMLAQSPQMTMDISKAGKETITRRSWGSVLGPLEGLYDQLIAQRQLIGLRSEGPVWMNDPAALLRASCAADALANVIPKVRKKTMSVSKGIRMLREMTEKQSIFDIAKGAAMLRGASFKTGIALKS